MYQLIGVYVAYAIRFWSWTWPNNALYGTIVVNSWSSSQINQIVMLRMLNSSSACQIFTNNNKTSLFLIQPSCAEIQNKTNETHLWHRAINQMWHLKPKILVTLP